ncbi:MAG: DUF4369 domain-containing protein [Tannerellaceae bacterium]|nr:DUF4369 domain-containing protein [Tannerellaceae bacterium]
MKKRIALFCLIISLINCNSSQTDSFTLQGSITGYEDKEILTLSYFSLQEDEMWYEITDTAEIINGKFTFKGKIDELTLGYLCLDNGNHCIELYMEPCRMKIKIDPEQPYAYKLTGTKTRNEISELKKETLSYEKIIYENNSNAEKLHEVYARFASDHINYKITPTLLYLTARGEYVSNELTKFIYNTLPETQKKTFMGKLAHQQIQHKELKQ